MNWASTYENLLWGFVNNKGTDQPANPRRQISAFVIRFLKIIISKLATADFNFLASLCSCSLVLVCNGVARTLKSYAHRRETTGSSIDSLHLLPFSKRELLLKERIFSQREWILSFKSSSLWYTTLGDLPWMMLFLLRMCVMRATPMVWPGGKLRRQVFSRQGPINVMYILHSI